MITSTQIGWLAGLLEGEGYFAYREVQGLTIQISMTDFDVIHRVSSLLGFGSIHKCPARPDRKQAWRWSAGGQPQVAGLMMTLLPLMGERRAAKIRECLALWKERGLPRRQWTHCKNGHELSGENLRLVTEGKYTKRRCVECGMLRMRKHRAKAA
jgi:hypothetical protein